MVRCGLAHTSVTVKGRTTVEWNQADTSGLTITVGADVKWDLVGLSRSSAVTDETTITNGKEQSDEKSTTVDFADCAFKGKEIDENYTYVFGSSA